MKPTVSRSTPGRDRRRAAGFTLVELLAAMVVLSIIVLIVGNLFTQASNSWRAGSQKIEAITTGRAAIDYLAFDLAQALVDDRVGLAVRQGVTKPYNTPCDDIYFVSMGQSPCQPVVKRDSAQVRYEVRKKPKQVITEPTCYRISRHWKWDYTDIETNSVLSFSAYVARDWWQKPGFDTSRGGDPRYEPACVIDYVSALRFYVYDSNGVYRANYDSVRDGVPLYVDIYLEVLGKDAARRAETLSGQALASLVARSCTRFQTRVYFQNGENYVARHEGADGKQK